MKKSLKIGFSGHPGVGKSTLIKQISRSIDNVITTDEPARIVIDLLGIEEDKTSFQKAVLSSFITVEYEIDKLRKIDNDRHFIFDRILSDVFIFFEYYKLDKGLIQMLVEKVSNFYRKGVLKPYNAIYILNSGPKFIEKYKDFYLENLKDNQRKVMDEYSLLENYIIMCKEFSDISLKYITLLQKLSGEKFFENLFIIESEGFILNENDTVYEVLDRKNMFVINDIKMFIQEVNEDVTF